MAHRVGHPGSAPVRTLLVASLEVCPVGSLPRPPVSPTVPHFENSPMAYAPGLGGWTEVEPVFDGGPIESTSSALLASTPNGSEDRGRDGASRGHAGRAGRFPSHDTSEDRRAPRRGELGPDDDRGPALPVDPLRGRDMGSRSARRPLACGLPGATLPRPTAFGDGREGCANPRAPRDLRADHGHGSAPAPRDPARFLAGALRLASAPNPAAELRLPGARGARARARLPARAGPLAASGRRVERRRLDLASDLVVPPPRSLRIPRVRSRPRVCARLRGTVSLAQHSSQTVCGDALQADRCRPERNPFPPRLSGSCTAIPSRGESK